MRILCSQNNNIAIVTLDYPPLNILSKVLIETLNQTLHTLEDDDAVKVVILTHTTKAFSAGADLKEFLALSSEDPDPILKWYALNSFSKPIIACVNGYCLGGGLELALMCDLLYASTASFFGFPEITLGLIPGGGGTQLIQKRLRPCQAAQILLTGEKISAQQAKDWNLINDCFDPATYFEHTMHIAQTLARHSLKALQAIKKNLRNPHTFSNMEKAFQEERSDFYKLLAEKDVQDTIFNFLNVKKK